MNKRQKGILLALGALGALSLAGGAGYWLASAPQTQAPAAATAKAAAPEARDSLPPSDSVASIAPPPAAAAEDDSAALPPPDSETLGQQAAQAPHESPRALLEFAHSLSGLMVRALESEEVGREGFGELETCANDDSGKASIQARLVCLANAKRLAEQWPDSLKNRMNALQSRNSRLVGMLEATGL
jgi:hypothetical protein